MTTITYGGPIEFKPYGEGLPKYYATKEGEDRPVLIASILSRNGALGAVVIYRYEDKFYLHAGSETTGKPWKSPEDGFDTIELVIEKANQLWKPAF